MDRQVEPRRHLTLCDFFPTFLQLLHLLLGAVPIPRREVDLCTSLLNIPGDGPHLRRCSDQFLRELDLVQGHHAHDKDVQEACFNGPDLQPDALQVDGFKKGDKLPDYPTWTLTARP